MLNIFIYATIFILTSYYVYFLLQVYIGLKKLKFAKTISQKTISVIVAARNEEKNIEQCITSLLNQAYPKELFEIIIVDDNSTDATSDIVQSKFQNVVLIKRNNVVGSKPLAIAEGIKIAKGEIILTTDADCIVPRRWIEIMQSHFTDDVVFVAGPVLEKASSSVFSKLEALEFFGLITTAAGLIGYGRPIICNGANMGYTKKSYLLANGFDSNGSNDDEYLMNKIVFNKIGKAVFASEPEAIIYTQSSNTIKSFFMQRLRWANKRGHYQDKSILFTLVLLYAFFLSLFVLTISLLFNFDYILALVTAVAVKMIAEYLVLKEGAIIFKFKIQAKYFLFAEIFHIPYIVVAAAIGQFVSLRWKERKI